MKQLTREAYESWLERHDSFLRLFRIDPFDATFEGHQEQLIIERDKALESLDMDYLADSLGNCLVSVVSLDIVAPEWAVEFIEEADQFLAQHFRRAR